MKKRLLLGVMLLGAFAANAQIADGADAPQFSGNRIVSIDGDQVTYGEEISLQTYLDAGKTVVVDMSAAWCGPCWSFHLSHTLENLHAAYGPEGSDELVVIFIEADPSTNVLELDGQSLPPEGGYPERGPSQGDWLAGTPYPVINNDTAAADYGLEAFPSLYIITPSGTPGELGKVTNLERDTMANMVAAINEARGSEMVGLDNWGAIEAAPLRSCDETLAVSAYVQGFGHDVTSVEAQLKQNGEVVATQTFSGLDLQAFEYGEITFDGVEADGTATYQAVLTQVNGAAALNTMPENNISEEYAVIPNAAVESSANVNVVLHTDEYPAEMKLYIIYYNEDGDAMIAWQTPTYTNSPTYKEKTLNYTIDFTTISAVTPDTCLGVVLQDNYGDGWVTNESGPDVEHGVKITSADGTVLFENDGNIGQQFWQDATFKENGVLGNETFETSSFAIYPNPSTGIFNFNTQETIDVTVVDITGKTVHTAKGIENGGSINLSGLQTGMYIAKINGASGERVEKLIIK